MERERYACRTPRAVRVSPGPGGMGARSRRFGAARFAALRAACRLKPAFQAVCDIFALELHVEVGAALAPWGL